MSITRLESNRQLATRMMGAVALCALAMFSACAANLADGEVAEEELADHGEVTGDEQELAAAANLSFTLGGDRGLQFVNNPEQLRAIDLADHDRGNKIIYQEEGVTGRQRNWFQHVNFTGFTIGYAVRAWNPGPNTVTIVNHGTGFHNTSIGGKPFASLFNNYNAAGTSVTVPPGRSAWMLRVDGGIPNGRFFSGVVDYDVIGGPVVIDNLAYTSFGKMWTPIYMGYTGRGEPNGLDEAVVYKGYSPHSETMGTLAVTIGDADRGPVNVSYPLYDLASGSFRAPTTRSYFITHIGPAMNAEAVTTDEISWVTPGFGPMSTLTKSDKRGNYPNWGNWAVLYKMKTRVTNTGTRARRLQLLVRAAPGEGCNAVIAWQGDDSVWRDGNLLAGAQQAYRTFTVAAGATVEPSAQLVLGGPACGALRHQLVVDP